MLNSKVGQNKIEVKLISSEHGFDDFEVSNLPNVHRACVGHNIKKGDIFNVYCSDCVKLGGIWDGDVKSSLAEFAVANVLYQQLQPKPELAAAKTLDVEVESICNRLLDSEEHAGESAIPEIAQEAVDLIQRIVSEKHGVDTFFQELLDSVETLDSIVDEHGSRTLADLMYLQNAILKGGFIDNYPGESKVLEIASALPSGDLWSKFIVE